MIGRRIHTENADPQPGCRWSAAAFGLFLVAWLAWFGAGLFLLTAAGRWLWNHA